MAGVKGRSGGARFGAGRKPHSAREVWLGGNAGKRKPLPQTDADQPPKPLAPVACPWNLTPAEVEVWVEIAPHALEERTLTPTKVQAFGDLCRAIVLERKLAAEDPGSANHRGMMQRVEAGRARFRLTADGKPALVPEQPQDEFAEFEGPHLVKGA